jgi:hypothetical protein
VETVVAGVGDNTVVDEIVKGISQQYFLFTYVGVKHRLELEVGCCKSYTI